MNDTAPLIPPGYLFSQHSLSTYLRCPRRFLYKYVDHQPWPQPEDEDPREYEEHLARGRTLHTWLERQHLGLDMEPIVAACEDERLWTWWRAAQSFDRTALPSGVREAELPLVVPLGSYGLYARYDYVALDPGGEAVVVDWKTLEARPSLRALRERIQTRVYLYALVAAGHVLSGGPPVVPSQVRMLYWFANFPEDTATIPYSLQSYRSDARNLCQLVEGIAHGPRESFVCADDPRLCARCSYCSLCGRDKTVPSADVQGWLDEDIDFGLDLDEAEELEY